MLFLTSLLLAPAALAAPFNGPPSFSHGGGRGGSRGGFHGPPSFNHGKSSAAYFLDIDPSGNSIVSLHISENGSLSNPIRTSTGGMGAFSVDDMGQAMMADVLGGQGAVHVSDHMLFTVNSGSNTLSMFEINPFDPYHPKLVGSPADTLGDFPISVDYSAKLRKACVLNGGATAGVTCFSVDSFHGLSADGGLRKLSDSVIDETTPPNGPPGSAAQVLFNPDSSAIFATVKGNGKDNPLGSFAVWPVEGDDVSTSAPVITQIGDITTNFGFQFLDESTVYLSDPSFGVSILTVGSDWKLTETIHTVIPSQEAICWTQSYPKLNTLYAIDAAVNKIYTMDADTGAQTGFIPVMPPGGDENPGVFDSSIANGLMYSLAATNGIFVVDLAAEKQVQYLDLSSFGDRQGYQGMAVWP